jgi:DNA-binding NtrC family response regulator
MATPLRVLIVEDEPMISMYLEEIVEETVPAIVTIKSSVKATRQVIDEPFHLALLDVDVTDGKTMRSRRRLKRKVDNTLWTKPRLLLRNIRDRDYEISHWPFSGSRMPMS